MEQLHVRLLGAFHLTYGNDVVTAVSSGRLQSLCAFLLLHRDAPLARDHVAFRFWPNVSEKKARNNLRQLLYRLRKALPDADRFIVVDNETIGWRADAPFTLDVAAFEKALAEASSPDDVKAALEQYRGPLLPDSYDAWALQERERLQQRYLAGLERLATLYEQQGNYRAAAAQLRKLLLEEPLRENSTRRLMRVHAHLRDPAGVERVYQECCRRLEAELSVSPSPALQEAYERLVQVAVGDGHQVRLPPQPPPFVGREQTLSEVGQRLRDPDCRLLSLVGPGGVGKTRLAIEAARTNAVDFRDGAAFASLASLSSPEYLATAVGTALDLNFSTHAPPRRQLIDHLRDKEMLLLLDNYEHLLPETGMIQEIIAEAQGVQLLVTSRARLCLRWEWVLDVDGLPLPDDESPQATHAGAARLLVFHLRRVGADFTLADGDLPAIVRISRLAGGMPLALELAAAAARHLPLPHLARRLAESADALALSHRDAPPRHWSMRAAFDHSWHLLRDREQDVFARLSIFRGGFDRHAAAAVAGATSHSLDALVDQSLLRRKGDDRYTVHELLRQYGAERLAARPEREAATVHAHCHHYATLVDDAVNDSPDMPAFMTTLNRDLDNVRHAWSTAVAARDAPALEQMVLGVGWFYENKNWRDDARAAFATAIDAMRSLVDAQGDDAPAAQRALGQLLILFWLFSQSEADDIQQYRRWADEAVQLLQAAAGTPLSLALALATRGHLVLSAGAVARAQADYERSVSLVNELPLLWQPLPFYFRGNGYLAVGDVAEAKAWLEKALALAQGCQCSFVVAGVLLSLGQAASRREAYAEAESLLQEAIRVSAARHDDVRNALAHRYLAVAVMAQGEYERARQICLDARSQDLYRYLPKDEADLLRVLGEACHRLGETAAAADYLCAALERTRQYRVEVKGLNALIAGARLLATADPAGARDLLVYVRDHPATLPGTKTAAENALEELPAVPAHAPSPAGRWDGQPLWSVVAEVSALLQ